MKKFFINEEMAELLNNAFSQEELDQMTDEEKFNFCADAEEYSKIAFDDLLASRGEY